MQSKFRHIAEDVRRQIEELLSGVGLLFRVFGRGKDTESLARKMQQSPGKYGVNGKLVQDAVGIRVALYFSEDIPIVKSILDSKYHLDAASTTIDKPDSDQFSVTRYNLIYRLPEDTIGAFQRVAGDEPLDATFEVQLRSILSEGWHEIEHDLRYKSQKNWLGHDDLSRALNGVVATLETTEWSMGRIFDELAYRHYKKKNWPGMLPNLLKMRIRGELSAELTRALDQNPNIAKDILRIDRAKLVRRLSIAKPRLPITMENLVFLWNVSGPRHEQIIQITPTLILTAAESIDDPY